MFLISNKLGQLWPVNLLRPTTDNQLFSSSAHWKFANSCTILMVQKLGQSTLFVKVDFKGLALTDFFTLVMAFTTKLRFVVSWLTSAATFKAIKVIKSMLKSAPNPADNFANFRWAELLKSSLSVVGCNRFTGYAIFSISKQFTLSHQNSNFQVQGRNFFVCLMLWQKKSASSDKIVPLQFGTEVEVGRDSSPDCRDFIVLQLLFLLLEVIWKRSPTESSVPVKICIQQ